MTNEIIVDIIAWYIVVIIGSILLISLIIVVLYMIVKDKIHDSYHQGFRDSMKENVNYYKAMRELIDSFQIIYNMLYKDQTKVKVELATSLIEFRDKLIEYSNK